MTHEEKPWSPTIENEPVFNPFANPQEGQPLHPVRIIEDEEEEAGQDEVEGGAPDVAK